VDAPFIVDVADAPAHGRPGRAITADLEPDDARWPDTGVNIQILQPAQPNCLYHSEPVHDDFLVLHGECAPIIDGDERPLRQWDFLHCPALTGAAAPAFVRALAIHATRRSRTAYSRRS
jgi:hypothetical protein